MIIESQDGTCKIDTEDVSYYREGEGTILAVFHTGLVFLLGEYRDTSSALATLRYVLSDPDRSYYKMYEEEI